MSCTRELAPYLTEPAQMPSGSVGKNGRLRLDFEERGERTALVTLERNVPLHVQQALYWDEAMPELACVYVIDTSGCVLQGDRYRLELHLGPRARAHITTQAATKIHEMDANYAAQEQEIVLAADSYLEYLPKPIIPHKHSRFVSRTHITLGPGATLLYAETLMSGRKYYAAGEQFAYDLFASDLCITRPDRTELVGEHLVLEPARFPLNRLGVMGEFEMFANVYLLTTPEFTGRVLPRITPAICRDKGWAVGASLLPNDAGLVYKILGIKSETVSALVREFWALVRETIHRVGLPRPVWG